MPVTVMLIRHAEKPVAAEPPHGVSIDGEPDPESLTPRGWQRAGALVGLMTHSFGESNEPAGRTFSTPTYLFASKVGLGSGSRRSLETLEPLAGRLGLTVDTRFLKEELGQLVGAIQATDGVVLVAWEHRLIPAIATMIVGDADAIPQIWPDDRYDIVWILEHVDGTPELVFRQLPQLLLAGDRAAPISPGTSA
jgi:broad specificity phosphatase PhoE